MDAPSWTDRDPRGTKRRSQSPIPSRRAPKSPRKQYQDERAVSRRENERPGRSQKEQVRLNQLQEDERSREWVAQEDDFVLKQAKKRAAIRVKDGRGKPIDRLAVALRVIDTTKTHLDDEIEDDEIQVEDPSQIFDSLSQTQLFELEKEIDTFQHLEKNARNREYWSTMLLICRDRKQKHSNNPEGRAMNSVASDIDLLLQDKNLKQLEGLEAQVHRKLDSNEPIDTDYWEQLLKSLLVWKAKARLKEIYQTILGSRAPAARTVTLAEPVSAPKAEAPSRNQAVVSRSDGEHKAQSATPLSSSTNRFAVPVQEDFSQATKALYEKEVARGIDEGEEIFAGEEDLDTKSTPAWSGKYRPRKPRYFNRVQMGYEWNKYNQTHYDHDNPPPKVVQGYKFNIFYPDLIDKTKAPTYKIEREGGRKKGQSFAPAGEEDTCLMRFISGPPYEDIAFRIVDKEWDYSAKRERGFKSSFDKGILQLHFQFKKVFYRK